MSAAAASKRIPLEVCAALLPGAILSVLLLESAIALNILLCVSASLGIDYLLSQRQRAAFAQGAPAAILTGVLLALTLPTGIPAWLCISAAGFAILMGRYLLRSLRLNPVMLTFAVLLVAFPAQMSLWPQTLAPDALSSATPLESLRTLLRQQRTFSEITTHLPQTASWMWISLGYLLGGIFLIKRRIIRWQIPASVLAGLLLPALVFWAMDADRYASPAFHALTGSTMLGAFFIATDPSTAARTMRACLIAGVSIGLMIWVIRTWGRYPDGFAFSVLLVNLATPAIESLSAPARRRLALIALSGLLVLASSLLLIQPYQSTWAQLSGNELDLKLRELLSDTVHDNRPVDDTRTFSDPSLCANQPATVYRARHQGSVVATVFRVVAPDGYNGGIELLVGIDATGKLLGLRVLRHQETRGFGDPAHLETSGATVTHTAVNRVVGKTLKYFLQHRTELLSAS